MHSSIGNTLSDMRVVSLAFQVVVRGQTQGLRLHLLSDSGVISVIEMVNVYSLKNRNIIIPTISIISLKKGHINNIIRKKQTHVVLSVFIYI
jgi:hypothetical protein